MHVRTPATSANLGPGFDVLGLALGLYADLGTGPPPAGAHALDDDHPARGPYADLGGTGALWLRSTIPMARGLGFSGAVRVGAAALAVCGRDGAAQGAIADATDEIVRVAAAHEGHGDNVAAALHGGLVAYVGGTVVTIAVGPVLAAATVVAWIPDTTTSTDRSRRSLPTTVERAAAVSNIGRSIQLAMAFAGDDPELLAGATDDALHQAARLALVPGAADALAAGVAAGAWCGWLSGSGPTVALLCAPDAVAAVVEALPAGAHTKQLPIDTEGARLVGS